MARMSTLKYISPDSEYLLEQSKKNVRFENMPPTVEDNDLSSEHSAEGSPNQRRLPTEEEKTLACKPSKTATLIMFRLITRVCSIGTMENPAAFYQFKPAF